jgi:hypothetical protein
MRYGNRWFLEKPLMEDGPPQRLANFTNTEAYEITLLEKSNRTSGWNPYSSLMCNLLLYLEIRFSNFTQCDNADCREEERYYITLMETVLVNAITGF